MTKKIKENRRIETKLIMNEKSDRNISYILYNY